MDNDDLGRRHVIRGLLDHHETPAVRRYVIRPAITHTFGRIPPIDDLRWPLRAPRAGSRMYLTRHDGAARCYIEQLRAVRRPQWPGAARRRDQPLPGLRRGKRPDVDL